MEIGHMAKENIFSLVWLVSDNGGVETDLEKREGFYRESV